MPPHPADLERILPKEIIDKAMNKPVAETPPVAPDDTVACTDAEKALILELVRFAKNPTSQFLIARLHDVIPRLSKKEILAVVRSLIASGEIQPLG